MAAEGAGFEESEHWYDHLEKHIGWKSLGKIFCGWVTPYCVVFNCHTVCP